MPDMWIVIVEDRHADVEALPYTTEELAVAAARKRVPGFAEEMRRDGWVLYLSYGTEGDCVRVVRRAVDQP